MTFKKKLMVLLAAGIMALSVSPFAFAEPEDETEAVDNETQQEQMDNSIAANAALAQQEQSAASVSETEFVNKRYLTKGGAAFWFIFIFVLNGAFSFWVGNRFYRLARKDNHITAEIRALRRDIEDKMVNNIGGFAEDEPVVENHNENLAPDDESIKPPEKKSVIRELSPEEQERFKQWEMAQSNPATRGGRSRNRSAVREELEEDFSEVKKINRKNYQPKRETEDIPEAEDTDDENLGETKEIKLRGESVKNRAKEILGDIFPFKDE